MKLHELEILHEDLIDITIGKKTFVLTENNKNYQLGKKEKSVYFKDTNGFGTSGDKVITHGGSHILELLIPVGVVK